MRKENQAFEISRDLLEKSKGYIQVKKNLYLEFEFWEVCQTYQKILDP